MPCPRREARSVRPRWPWGRAGSGTNRSTVRGTQGRSGEEEGAGESEDGGQEEGSGAHRGRAD